MCAEQGVDCVEVPTWSVDACKKSLASLRKYGIKGFTTSGPETSMDTRSVVKTGGPCERAVCIGGAYRGLSIDRNVFEFSAGPHEIVVEPPVYAAGQPYARKRKEADGSETVVKSGHYFGSFRPTGEAEIVVPERLFDGEQHLRIVPCEVLPARPGDVPENDSAAGMSGPEIENRRLVRLRFDLSCCEDCLLDKVGIAVFWESDPDSGTWQSGTGQLSVFSEITREAARSAGEWRANQWAIANGGAFPSGEIVAIRFGDECFNLTGWVDGPACSFPLWGFSESGRKAFSAAAANSSLVTRHSSLVTRHSSLTAAAEAAPLQPRTIGFPEIYGETACGIALCEYHKACAGLAAAFREGVHSVTPDMLVFRNTTRGDVWSEANDHDGTGQELLAHQLDFLHLDPYPVTASYDENRIPRDMGYMAGLARRFGKPLVPWMQAHAYAPGGLGHVTPGQIRRMWAQHKAFAPAGVMWLGFGRRANPQDFVSMTFPDGSPESWAYAKQFHAELHGEAAKAARSDEDSSPVTPPSSPVTRRSSLSSGSCASPETAKPLALVRPYSVRASCCNLSGGRWRNPADRHLQAFAEAWGIDCGLPFDVFETPPAPTPEEEAAIAAELARYDLAVSTAPVPGVPGARILGAGTNGTILDIAGFAALRRAFADEIAARTKTGDAAVRTGDAAGKLEMKRVFDVRDFGARCDGIAKDTAAIQRAVDAAAAGGGEVLLPAGTYLSGSVSLKSGVDFHLAEGAVLKASPDPADYNAADAFPQNRASPRRGDNQSGGHLLFAAGAEGVSITGPGRIEGNAAAFLRMPDGSHPPTKHDIPWRPGQMVCFAECRNVAIRDVELADAPYWSCFLHGCEDVTVENARIHTVRAPHAYNGDGLDIDCCRRVRVRGCDISTADDALTLRADPARLLRPGDCADVTVEDCTLSSDCNAIRLGVGNGEVRDASFSGISIRGSRTAVNAVGSWARGERGCDIRRVSFDRLDVEARTFCHIYYKFATGSVFEDIAFRRVRGKVAGPSRIDDTPDRPFRGLVFEDVALEGETSPRVTPATKP